ncbi:MAG TPA: bifunctional diaminohydroxyphosphoribosylaminopyrimidine deaminase/5-amino-6-(5-phosphoribosylamino)uracil reductase RibD [Planctomycetota bacterium]|nr:bifunctional diaminohydroxyphosphoribosylaminopyrimidine deaminase/5-amino-6-(5-phosphoribosylamino)uracil reductase RibD [Planctomycetota bacterium]
MDDALAMREALALAARGRGNVEPNPRVGALALRDGEIVGRGFHRAWGEPHAEVEALRDAAKAGARPDTVVVTLEPCAAEPGEGGKKTGSCTRALLEAGVRRVVYGASDADPRHRGRGPGLLRAAGVEVVGGVEAEACAALNRPFARWLTLARPWTIAKWAMSLDGKIATRTGASRWISGEAARRSVHELRARVDAVAVGFRTVLRDDPLLTVRDVPGPSPLRVVIDPEAALPLGTRLVQTAREVPVLALVGAQAPEERCVALATAGVEVLRVGASGEVAGSRAFDVAAAWRLLRGRGVRRLLVEGGGRLAASLFAADIVDQVLAFVAPVVLGGEDAPTPVMGEGVGELAQAWRFPESVVHEVGGDAAISAIR